MLKVILEKTKVFYWGSRKAYQTLPTLSSLLTYKYVQVGVLGSYVIKLIPKVFSGPLAVCLSILTISHWQRPSESPLQPKHRKLINTVLGDQMRPPHTHTHKYVSPIPKTRVLWFG